jgi:shikimate dehydrogenase
LVGLIGWPVEHSVSPAMHNAAFEALGLDWCYSLLPTPPGSVEARLAELKARGFRGANVTVPHKQTVMPFLDEIDEAALAIGAANTILVQGDRLIGCNTDAGGFLNALRDAGFEPSDRRALVLGAGGAARAVVYALVRSGASVVLHNRTASRAAKLARSMQDTSLQGSVAWMAAETSLADLPLASFDLLVNTTPVGMWPKTDANPWPERLPMPSRWTVNDLVYNPAQTRLLARAQAAGAAVVGGLGMLVHQGALAFEMWTGQAPPADVMHVAAERALGQGSPEGAGTGD